MISKALLVFCLVSVAVCEDLDSLLGDIFGSTEATSSTETTVPTYKPCLVRDGVDGECVPYYRCQIQEVGELIDIHLPVKEPCDNYLHVCCAPTERIEPTTEETKASE